MAVVLTVPLAAGAATALGAPQTSQAARADLPPAETVALVQAHASGRPVEVVSARTAYAELTANPNGSLTYQAYGQARWAAAGSGWVSADASLVRNGDGSFSPRSAGAKVRLSGGGGGALAVISTSAGSLSLSWPSQLPVPQLEGASALYREVAPGVDLQVTATVAGGVDEALIVKNARGAANAEAASEDLGLTVSKGLAVKADATGALTVTGKGGAVVFASAVPRAWDSAGGGSSAVTPGRKAARAVVGVHMDARGEHLAVPTGLLRGPGVHYPVYVDPQYTVGPSWQNFGLVDSSAPGAGERDPSGVTAGGVGYDGTGVQRTYWQTEIPAVLAGTTVLSASLGYEVYTAQSPSSTTTTLDLYQAAPFAAALTWDSQPGQAAGPSVSTFTTTSATPDAQESFDVTAFIQNEVNAGASGWLAELANANESSAANYVTVSTYPTLTITHDPTPSGVYGFEMAPGSYPSVGGYYTSSLTPTLESAASDANGAPLAYQFQVEQNGTTLETETSPFNPQGTSALGQWPASPALADATTYQVVIRSYDGTVYGPWSSAYSFTTQAAAPAAPAVTCTGYAGNVGTPLVSGGSACTFTDTQSPLNGYIYSLTDPSGTETWGWSGNGVASIDPASPGPYTLDVFAQNAAGTNGPTTGYAFTATQAPAITGASGASFTAGVAGSFTVSTSGYPDAALTEAGTLPAGLGFTDNGDGTATIAGTPAAGATGSYPITVTAANGVGSPTTEALTIVVADQLAVTGMGVWKTTDPVTSAAMDCVLWQVTGGSPDTLAGAIHYELESTAAGSNPQASTDWSIAYTAAGSYTGTTGAYSWCSDTGLLPSSPAGDVWVPVSFTASDGRGGTLTLNTAALAGLSATDPSGASDPAAFTN